MCRKIISLLLFFSFCQRGAALTTLQEQAKDIVNMYYTRLQEYANNPGKEQNAKINELFEDRNIVNNDLNELADVFRYKESEDDIKNYLATIMNFWVKEVTVSIKGSVDESTFVEQEDPDIKETGKKIIWVTVNKYIFVEGYINKSTRETFKIKNGSIQTISTPERATSRINTLNLYNNGDDESAYYSLIKDIENGAADDDTYYYLGLMFRKGDSVCKRLFPSKELRDKLCTFYWMKSERGKKALYYFGMHTYYIRDNVNITNPFPCGLMLVYKGNGEKFGYIDKKGNVVIPYKFIMAYNFMSEINRAIVVVNNGLFGVIDTKGNFVFQPKYQSLMSPSENLWPYQENYLWGFLDDNGKVAIPAQYDSVLGFSSGLAPFSKGKKYGYIDHSNNVVIPATYDYAGRFFTKMQVAFVHLDHKCGVIDKNGKIVVPIKYDEIEIKEDNNYFIVKRKGQKQEIINYEPAAIGKVSSKKAINEPIFTH